MAPSRKDEDQLLALLRDARLWAEVDSHLASRGGVVDHPIVEVADQIVEISEQPAPGARPTPAELTDPLS